MNEQIKQRWIEALRSGEYEQTQGRLHDKTGYCCLGVLTDLYAKETNIEWEEGEVSGVKIYSLNGISGLLPEQVMQWSELNVCNPGTFIDNQLVVLSHQNDLGLSFREIADLIEKNF